MAQTGPRDKATIEALKERMARDPLSRAFLQLAEEYRKAGRFEEAVQVCNEGLARHPGYHTARIALGRTYLDAGDLESAHQALIEVLDSMPENHLAAKLLADVQLRLGNRAGAAETYRSILSHYPGDREVEGLLQELEGEGQAAPAAPVADPAAMPTAPLEIVDGGVPQAVSPTSGATETAAGTEGHSTIRSEPPPQWGERSPEPRRARDEQMPQGTGPIERPESSPPVRSGSEPESEAAGTDALQTNTLAELYLRQGLVERAIEVYRAMLQVDPGNDQARQRLQELAGSDAPDSGDSAPYREHASRAPIEPPAVAEPAAGSEVTAGARVIAEAVIDLSGDRSVDPAPPVAASVGATETAATSPRMIPRHAATIDRLEHWLLTIQAGPSRPEGGADR